MLLIYFKHILIPQYETLFEGKWVPMEHPEIEEKVPENAMIVLFPDYDKEFAETNLKLADANREPGQTIVYVRVEKLRASRIEGLILQLG